MAAFSLPRMVMLKEKDALGRGRESLAIGDLVVEKQTKDDEGLQRIEHGGLEH
jgi:hypothetical protein